MSDDRVSVRLKSHRKSYVLLISSIFRVGDVVPGVVVYLYHSLTYIITHHGLGGFSGLINGLIAAAIGALSMLMSEPTAKSYVKRTCMFVLSIATFTFYIYISFIV